MGSLMRTAWLEARVLWRVAGLPLAILLSVHVAVVKVQEPAFLQTAGRSFFWPSVRSGLTLVLCLLPLVWSLATHRAHEAWRWVGSTSPGRSVAIGWIGIMLFGACVIGLTSVAAFTLESIYDGRLRTGELCTTLASSACLLSPLAALGPALGQLGQASQVTAWCALLAASLGVFGVGFPIPLDRFLTTFDSWTTGALGAAAVILVETTCAGLMISYAVTFRGLRN